MNSKIIDEEMLMRDIRSATCSVRTLKQRIIVSRNDNDIYSRIENFIKNQGYVFKVSRAQKTFTISVSSCLSIIGKVGKIYIELSFVIHLDGLEVSSRSADCGNIKFSMSDLDFLFLPLIDKMISDGLALNKKYVELRKKEMIAELLAPLVCEYLKDMRNIYVRPDEAGIIWVLKIIDGNTLVRVPIDFENYQSQCDAWLKVVNNEKLWTIEHKDTKVQVLKSQYSYGNKLEWINIATNEWYYNLKV